jgi:ABC-type nitrate/sulfonate/bicarbonate transport system ATPase subunit/ABC-type nitrate/sulfonate/bicarbonate transport system permease component
MRKNILPTLLSILFIAAAWQLIALQIGFPAIFPTLPDLMIQLFGVFKSPDFFATVLSTLLRGIIGFALSLLFAFILSTIAAFSPFWKSFFHPIVVITRSIPVISFVLLAILWFSPTYMPIFIALLTMFPILYQNILTGFEHTDKKWIEMAKVYNKSFYKRFISIYIPASKSNIFDGISTSLGFGWRAIIIGEVLAQPFRGIGTSMKLAQAYINVSELIAWTVVAIAISYLFDLVVKLFRKIRFGIKLPQPQSYNKNASTLTSQQVQLKRITTQNLNKTFNYKTIFKSFNITFNSENITCIKGPSGKGKTTLLRILAGIENYDSGAVTKPHFARFAFAFQDFRLLPWLTVSENIAFAVNQKTHNLQETSNLVGFLLEKMELPKEGSKFPNELSGGQQQRVSLARALAAKSDVLLLDEPLTGLDNALKNRIIAFLSDWIATYHPIVIWATHENINLKENAVNEIFI